MTSFKKKKINLSIFFNNLQSPGNNQREKLEEIAQSLRSFNIKLDVQYSTTLHDREIRYSGSVLL